MALTRKFLIVDDSYIDRLVSSLLVKRTLADADIVDVPGGNAALEWLNANASEQTQLVILLDIMMPQMNGFQFLDELEKMDGNLLNQMKVIMLSSTLDLDDINRAKAHPRVKELLSKPLSAHELKQAVDL